MRLADWGNLEELPLNLIFNKMGELIDHIYFSMVCKNWYSIAKFNYQNLQIKNNGLPMLLQRFLYGISPETIYPFKVPIPSKERLCGSSHGWLAKSISEDGTVTLMNPFKNRVSIHLPPIYKSRDINSRVRYNACNVHKVILSANPTIRPHDYVVVAIYDIGKGKALAFIKAGQNFWTHVEEAYSGFTDVIFYKDLVYAVGLKNNVIYFNIYNSKNSLYYRKFIFYVASSPEVDFAHRAYFVISLEGDLWLVKKFSGYATNFVVYKLELDLRNGKLIRMVKLDSLEDNVLFIGNCDSISMSASSFANYLQKDSIYYAKDDCEKDTDQDHCPCVQFDMEIYNIKDGSSTQHCRSQLCFTRTSPSLWVLPPST
ncbi:unnamed protein product [Lathyrus sativus]|nr:unnamed protein product [Lathyrus sativus]